jgi:hypothetical protein
MGEVSIRIGKKHGTFSDLEYMLLKKKKDKKKCEKLV